jgi:hypothetical protein
VYPVFPVLYSLGFRIIRYPEKFWVIAVFAITVHTAFAFDQIESIRRPLTICSRRDRVCVGLAAVGDHRRRNCLRTS